MAIACSPTPKSLPPGIENAMLQDALSVAGEEQGLALARAGGLFQGPRLVPDPGEEPAARLPDIAHSTATSLGHSCLGRQPLRCTTEPRAGQQGRGWEGGQATRPPISLRSPADPQDPRHLSGGSASSSTPDPHPRARGRGLAAPPPAPPPPPPPRAPGSAPLRARARALPSPGDRPCARRGRCAPGPGEGGELGSASRPPRSSPAATQAKPERASGAGPRDAHLSGRAGPAEEDARGPGPGLARSAALPAPPPTLPGEAAGSDGPDEVSRLPRFLFCPSGHRRSLSPDGDCARARAGPNRRSAGHARPRSPRACCWEESPSPPLARLPLLRTGRGRSLPEFPLPLSFGKMN